MSLSKVLEIAKLELGVTENPPGSNNVKYNTAYYGKPVSGSAYPWCVVLQWWIFQKAGERMSFFGGGRTASCRTLLRWYREQGLTADKQATQVGDIWILNFSGKKVNGELDTEHCGLVVEKGPLAGTWYCIEGNTSPGEEGSQDNGGCVALKLRSVRNVVGVCRPQYKPEEPEAIDDVTGHWAQTEIRWAKDNELVKGFPDGSFKPNQGVTRAELCVILYRFFKMILRLIRGEEDMK